MIFFFNDIFPPKPRAMCDHTNKICLYLIQYIFTYFVYYMYIRNLSTCVREERQRRRYSRRYPNGKTTLGGSRSGGPPLHDDNTVPTLKIRMELYGRNRYRNTHAVRNSPTGRKQFGNERIRRIRPCRIYRAQDKSSWHKLKSSSNNAKIRDVC